MPLQITLEDQTELNAQEQRRVQDAVAKLNHPRFAKVDRQVVADQLREWFPHWFIYRGGHHVALHRRPGSEKRVLLVATN